MRLYIVRHGKAEQESPTGMDRDRRLKPKGHRQAAFVGEAVLKNDRPPQRILASGYMRAQQTATEIAKVVGCQVAHETLLEPGHTASSIVSMLQSHAGVGSLMLVGHNPQCVDVLSIIARHLDANDAIVRTGETIVIDVRLSQPIGSGRVVERIRLDEAHTLSC